MTFVYFIVSDKQTKADEHGRHAVIVIDNFDGGLMWRPIRDLGDEK